MAASNSYDYNPTGAEIITDALRLLGALEEGGTASASQITDCLPSFEMYIKGLTKYGLHLWSINSHGETITLGAGIATVSTTNTPVKILEAIFRDSDGNDTNLIPLTREEYWALPDKDLSGEPSQFFFDPLDDAEDARSTIYLWPVPDATAATGTLEVVYQTHTEDVDDGTGDADNTLGMPQEWLETVKYGLATRLAPMYGYPVRERNLLLQEYQLMLQETLAWDTEQESVYLRPEPSYGK